MTKIYRYHIVLDDTVIEKNIPDRSQAEAYRQFLAQRDSLDYTIEREHVPQARGLGRDPDLH